MRFENKVTLVTGGSRGIGDAIVSEMYNNGAIVYFTFINLTKDLEQKTQNSKTNRIYPIQCDVRNYASVKTLLEQIIFDHDAIDFVINNAGITHDKPLALMSFQNWHEVINTNLTGTFNVCRCAILKMIKQKFGKIVNIASVSGLVGSPYQSNYAASKAGIVGFTKSLAREVASYGITVNAIAPGVIDTEMALKLDEKNRQRLLEMIPMKKYGSSRDVAFLVSYLLSEKANYITGEVIKIDGGLAA